ncbi:hypothetical protein B7R54_13730 [Subtercola boreus]|uniref:DUF2092 domain-containing protein n=1 Tax=Subtercola boreus TaxID=120213 RepID=A0A3E0VL39_9MICO|nr:DUF2092 domain-containing protein [Subtercola boreus]RFA10153.1 hypothetical protein B7R54_13730 [Subtercola boreus]TQL52687.1 hypothetical protein FB464_0170 [Subtercola boreus]
MSKVWKRWIPAAVVGVVVAGAAVAVPLSAGAAGALPTKSAEEVLALVAGSSVTGFSGTVEQTSDLGLPSLPAGAGSASGSSEGSSDSSAAAASSALELLTGSHTARVYVDTSNGAGNLRVQVLDQLAERDVIRSGDSLWLYDSAKQTAVHATAASTSAPDADPTSPAETATPQQLAQKFLAAADSTTDVTVGGDVTVAGRSAYDLVLTPQSGSTLVGAVSIAVDSATGLPLRVEVTAAGAADPAFSSSFTALDLSTPPADLFSFTPPAGTTVTEKTVPSGAASTAPANPAQEQYAHVPDASKPVVTGSGWSSIVEIPAGSDSSALTSSPLLAQLTTPVAGGNLLSTTLLNVFVASDGRVFAGSVPAEALEAAAAQ